MLSVKQGGIKHHFLSLWYDSTWDWTQVSRAIGQKIQTWGNCDEFISAKNIIFVSSNDLHVWFEGEKL